MDSNASRVGSRLMIHNLMQLQIGIQVFLSTHLVTMLIEQVVYLKYMVLSCHKEVL